MLSTCTTALRHQPFYSTQFKLKPTWHQPFYSIYFTHFHSLGHCSSRSKSNASLWRGFCNRSFPHKGYLEQSTTALRHQPFFSAQFKLKPTWHQPFYSIHFTHFHSLGHCSSRSKSNASPQSLLSAFYHRSCPNVGRSSFYHVFSFTVF